MSARARCVAAILAGLLLLGPGPAAAQPPSEPDAGALARRAAEALRGQRTYWEARVSVASRGRTIERRDVRVWDDRAGGRSRVDFLSADEDGRARLLRLAPNVWVHEPAAERTRRVPPAELFETWPVGDFSYDDWIHHTSETRDYVPRLLRTEEMESPDGPPGRRAHVLEYLPREGVVPAWARIVAWIDVERGCPLRRDYFDAEGVRRRSLLFGDVREVAGRFVPHRRVMVPAQPGGRETRVVLGRIEFDPVFDDSLFTTRQLGSPDSPPASP